MYEQEIVSVVAQIKRGFMLFLGSSAMAVLWLFAYSLYFSTPKEINLSKTTHNLLLEYEIMQMKLNEAENTLNRIMERDNKVYRAVFEEDTIPYSIRNAGFGGIDRYAKFDDLGIKYSDLLKTIHRKMDILYKKAYIQSKSFDRVGELAANKVLMQQSMPVSAPIDLTKVRLSSVFGVRRDPFFGYFRLHEGIDLSGSVGLPIYATGDGTVLRSTFAGAFGYGYLVEISHGFGYVTRYAHLSKMHVVEGARVKRGDKIGELGSTGKSRGPHLHYEVRLRGVPQNPLNYFKHSLDDNLDDLQWVDQGD
jgi:murein DD-endopeptidase MepM/ murein hydrolase activator NlpD